MNDENIVTAGTNPRTVLRTFKTNVHIKRAVIRMVPISASNTAFLRVMMGRNSNTTDVHDRALVPLWLVVNRGRRFSFLGSAGGKFRVFVYGIGLPEEESCGSEGSLQSRCRGLRHKG